MSALPRYTLKSRIITLMIVFSIVFTGAFCLIQVRNQVSTMTTFNSYKAKLSALIIKNNLEKTIKENPTAEVTPEKIKLLDNSLSSLRDSGMIENAVLFTPQGEIIAGAAAGTQPTRTDRRITEECSKVPEEGKWFIPQIDPQKKFVDLYIPLYDEGMLGYIVRARFSLGNIEEAMKQVYLPLVITAILVVILNVILGSILTRTIVKPIHILNRATKEIAGGNLKLKVDIKTKDEIEELGDTFNHMTASLEKMKERAENANPLTKLPGNNMIHEEITKRINTRRKFVVIYSDLDNFKAFNDKYGIGDGDKAIKLTADIMRESLKSGAHDDFLGHEGGDDFVIVSTPERAEKVAKYITEEFDKRVRALYNKEDLGQGFIMAHARDGNVQKFPIMTISLAGVGNEKRPLNSYGEITNICAEVKKKVKGVPKTNSVFMLDQRDK
ncbi:MAG: diguanylate cyclase [Candidatus Omnitrophica bacterium]|nr:diguanylate cyclase [Candidatus Omnitrophota bacterium]